MKVVKDGSKIKIICEAKLEDGSVCFQNKEDDPLEFVVGEGKFFLPIENKLKDMKEGETKTITIEPDEMFGPHLAELVIEVPKNVFKIEAKITVGSRIRIDAPSGKVFYGTVTAVKEETIILDLNHPLAGKKILWTVKILSIEGK
jgi:peptidylprolyl isomerase